MCSMEDADRQMIKEIHEALVGTLKEQGLIGRVVKLEESRNLYKKVAIGLAMPLIAVIGERIAALLL